MTKRHVAISKFFKATLKIQKLRGIFLRVKQKMKKKCYFLCSQGWAIKVTNKKLKHRNQLEVFKRIKF